MLVMSHQHRYGIRFELRYIILVHVCISQLSESAVIFGCVHMLEPEFKVDITSCRNEDKPSRMRFKCMLNDHYHLSLYKKNRNRHFRKIVVSTLCLSTFDKLSYARAPWLLCPTHALRAPYTFVMFFILWWAYMVARDLVLFSPVFLLPLLPFYRKEQLPLSADERVFTQLSRRTFRAQLVGAL